MLPAGLATVATVGRMTGAGWSAAVRRAMSSEAGGGGPRGMRLDEETVRKLKSGELPPLDFDLLHDIVDVVGEAIVSDELGDRFREAGAAPGVALTERWHMVQGLYAMAEELVLKEFELEGMDGRARYTASMHMYVLGDDDHVQIQAPEEVRAAAAEAARALRKVLDRNWNILLKTVGIDTDALPDSFTLDEVKAVLDECKIRVDAPPVKDQLVALGRDADLSSDDWQRALAFDIMQPLHMSVVSEKHGLAGEEGYVLSQYCSRHVAGHPQVAVLNMELQQAAMVHLETGLKSRE
ncbi:uncharacterized protein AMSG_07762 [Thecamonas trahens ATCC 50062]|uniref:Uncharacterized protein n=1 Tax=Thecamonas trahens ATCC 50062 TaxID=461836 RepID=A0A0L0DK26_THETB|nr:hypothetical protein AMSG_07762 [Thecamonas trahens ATCC 50062]KNC51698.1 hypothetical protein AMSG_07762 [Thecamonas trahens ATCC 50062]|eukprot:XP_013755827.1 hypothetical protein AMSG_07762 [Thecamonas trahens ATCC 50062]